TTKVVTTNSITGIAGQPMNNAGTWWLKGAWIELGLEQAFLDVVEAACQRYGAGSSPPLRVLTHAQAVLVRKTLSGKTIEMRVADLILSNNPQIVEQKRAQPIAGRIRVISKI
ncbi:MAG: hypothetical protein ACE5F6_21845, partial [Anaerolineae bacterium]